MPLLVILIIITACLNINLFAQTNPQKTIFSQIKIEPSISNTPTYNVNNVTNIETPNSHWILVDLTFTPIEKMSKTEPHGVYDLEDNLSIFFEVLLQNNKKIALLSTKIDYWSVFYDGKEKHAMACIPPAIFRRYAPTNTKLTKAFIKDLPIRITFFINGAQVQKAVYPESKIGAIFNSIDSNPNIIRAQNTLLDRSLTPWFNVSFDRYELVKPKSPIPQ